MSVLIQPWEAIEQFYVRMADRASAAPHLAQLVAAIRKSRYVSGLYAWTSMLDLCVVQTPATYPYHGPLLRISPVGSDALEFRYEDTSDKSKQWHRTVSGGSGFARLEHFIAQLGWFPASPSA